MQASCAQERWKRRRRRRRRASSEACTKTPPGRNNGHGAVRHRLRLFILPSRNRTHSCTALLLRKSSASFAISSLTVVHKTASLLSFTQTVVFSLYLQIVRNSNFKTPRVSKFRSFTQPPPSLSSFLKMV